MNEFREFAYNALGLLFLLALLVLVYWLLPDGIQDTVVDSVGRVWRIANRIADIILRILGAIWDAAE